MARHEGPSCEVSLHAIPDTVIRTMPTPIIRSDTVRCSRPEAFIAPRTVPTTAQQIPTKAIMTMNQRMLTVWLTTTPQQVLVSAPEC